MRDYDLDFLRMAIETARKAREHGNHPFGAVLVDAEGQFLMEAENTSTAGGLHRARRNQPDSQSILPAQPGDAGRQHLVYQHGAVRHVLGHHLLGRRQPGGVCPERNQPVRSNDRPKLLENACREVFFRSGRSIEVLGPCW